MIYLKSIHENDNEPELTPEEKDKKIEKKVKETEPKMMDESLSFMEAAYQICIENVRNWNNIMMAVALDELSYLDKEGKEKVYTEGGISSFFSKIAAIVESVWAKIKGLWRSFSTSFQSMFKKDNAFINKFAAVMEDGASIMKTKTSEENHPGYKFDKELSFPAAKSSIITYIGHLSSTLKESSALNEAESKSKADSAYVAEVRKAICPTATGNANTFSDECLSFIKGDEVKNIFTDFTVDQIKNEILSSDKYKEENQKAFIDTENIVKDELKKIEELKSDTNSDGLNEKITSAIQTVTEANNVLTLANAASMSALKARYTQAKTVAKRWIIVGKGKNDKEPNSVAADESAITPGNLLEGLNII